MALEYFTIAEFRALPDMTSSEKYPTARVEAAAAYIVGVIEREVGTSFIARTVIETLDTTGGDQIVLSTPYVLGVSSVVIDGQASSDVFSVKNGVLERRAAGSYTPLTWGVGRRNITVTYTEGYSATVPADVKEAALQGTRSYLLEHSSASAVMDRRSTVTNDAGTTQFVLAGPDRPTGYPEVDSVILGWKRKLNTVVYP